MKFVLPDFLEKNHTLNKLENLSICKYIQYEEQHKNEVFISTNILIFVIKGSKILHFKDEKIGKGEGFIALQIHDGGGIKVRWRKIMIEELP